MHHSCHGPSCKQLCVWPPQTPPLLPAWWTFTLIQKKKQRINQLRKLKTSYLFMSPAREQPQLSEVRSARIFFSFFIRRGLTLLGQRTSPKIAAACLHLSPAAAVHSYDIVSLERLTTLGDDHKHMVTKEHSRSLWVMWRCLTWRDHESWQVTNGDGKKNCTSSNSIKINPKCQFLSFLQISTACYDCSQLHNPHCTCIGDVEIVFSAYILGI